MNLNLNPHTFRSLGSVVQRPISANPGLNFTAGFFFFCSKAFSRIISRFFLEYRIN